MKFRLAFLLLLLSLSVAYPQKKGYIIRDSAYVNCTIVNTRRIYENNREVKFYAYQTAPLEILHPDRVSEYSFEGGDVYVARTVKAEGKNGRFFLLRLVDGDVDLYQLKVKNGSLFFAEKNNKLTALSPGSLQASLRSLFVSCPNFEPTILQASCNASSLTSAFNYFKKSCVNNRVLAQNRWGIIAGVSITQFIVQGNSFAEEKLKFKGSDPIVGAFVETPVGQKGHWFINVAAIYQRQHYALDLYEIKASLLNFPVLLKFRTSGQDIRAFFTAGPTVGYYLQNKNYEVKSQSDLGSIGRIEFGGNIGGGMEISVTPKNILALELRFSSNQGASAKQNKQSYHGPQVFLSMSF